ncbi:MAG: hypothetical protein KatS3mg028_0818 [Bacteroidia bacterium]|nr:MAG: hypothetical protein KatS3mg028_0818 [Bacteroidia bacterium]
MLKLSVNKYILFLSLSIALCINIYPQMSDKEIIANKNNINNEFEHNRNVTYLFKDKNFIIKYNPISLLFGLILFFRCWAKINLHPIKEKFSVPYPILTHHHPLYYPIDVLRSTTRLSSYKISHYLFLISIQQP